MVQGVILYALGSCLNIETKELSPSHWRSILKDKYGVKFGRSRADQKKAAQNFVKEHFNIVESEDTCDAICLGLAAVNEEKSQLSAF